MRSMAVPLVKLAVFAAVTVALTGVLGVTIAGTNFGPTTAYAAAFVDVTGLNEGDDVRMSGVRIGQVRDIDIVERRVARVRFEIDADRTLPAGVTAAIRYRNLIGQRYVALGYGAGADPNAVLGVGETIPIERTRPALNLTALFNGFKPLFHALSPQDVNKLSHEIIQVLQGEGGTMTNLLAHTESLTSAIADKDAVIGRVVDNLNLVLGTVNERSDEVSQLIGQLQQLVTGLAEQRKPIGDAITALGTLTDATTGLLTEARAPLKDSIAGLGALATNLDRDGDLVDRFVSGLPHKLETITRTASYGSWFNFYLCRLSGEVSVLDVTAPIAPLPATSMPERCGP
jgi:phospholipid/cholesterol/gamma-HCH transport system substrate-binding protein